MRDQDSGAMARILGADALVFPSARSDAFVEVMDGNVVGWGGWDLWTIQVLLLCERGHGHDL